jgi:uroporphyrin-III C-methyltransferase
MPAEQPPEQYLLFPNLQSLHDDGGNMTTLGIGPCAQPEHDDDMANHSTRPSTMRIGRASLVGVGPGDPELITVKALRVLRQADVILYDSLVNPIILNEARRDARRIDVGKRCGRHAMSQLMINKLILAEVAAGNHVVRLKGGDPFVFGRGGEELEALRSVGAEVDVVPGITTACAAAAGLRIPLTHRGIAQAIHFITGHGAEDDSLIHDWCALARSGGTLAIYMGSKTIDRLTERLIQAGLPPDMPALAVQNVSLPNENHVQCRVDAIAEQIGQLAAGGPILIMIGHVIALSNQVAGWQPEQSVPFAA